MNGPLITELIEKPANAEKIRNQIAAILSLELQNQYKLAMENGAKNAEDYDVKIFVENNRNYDTAEKELVSHVNVVLQEVVVPKSNPRIGGQTAQAKFDIYCLANGNAAGNFHDDRNVTFRAWKIMRLIWRIIMSEPYTYLGMRKTVTHRAFLKMEAGVPNEQWAQTFTVIRASLDVNFSEGYFGGPSVPFEGYDFEVVAENGQIVAVPSLRDRVTGTADSNPQEEKK